MLVCVCLQLPTFFLLHLLFKLLVNKPFLLLLSLNNIQMNTVCEYNIWALLETKEVRCIAFPPFTCRTIM